MKKLCLLALCTLLLLVSSPFVYAQGDDTTHGIKWSTGLSWEQIKQKAKAENKYIFLDCFTTWCGPCKRMDGEVYPKQSVGNYFNQRFISVRVQMDITPKDNEQVRSWYSDAAKIQNQFYIRAFPTLIFISPKGDVAEQQEGFKQEKNLVAFAENATKPGMAYKNIYKQYDELIDAYKNGDKNYDKYPFMIAMAKKQRDTVFRQLERELVQYMLILKPEDRYTKERLEVFSGYVYANTTHVYSFYFNDGNIVDKVMGEPGYSQQQIDKTIQAEIVSPFFKVQNKNPAIEMSGGYKLYVNGATAPPSDTSEADWVRLKKLIGAKYNSKYTKRNILIARVEWYTRHRNVQQQLKYQLSQLDEFPPNPKNVDDCDMTNGICWDVFMYSTDKKTLKKCSQYMEKVVKTWAQNPMTDWIDTYANLLYKLGKKDEAINWEQKAAQKDSNQFSPVVAQMKNNEPTYLKQGAVWKN